MSLRQYHLPLILTAIVLSLAQSTRADVYVVPAAPVAVTLRGDERVVSANADVTSTYRPHELYIRLAVLGPPAPEPPMRPPWTLVKAGIEDAPLPTLHPIEPVRPADISAVASILEKSGIQRSSIATALRQVERGVIIGEVRVRVEPATQRHFNAVASTVAAVLAKYDNIVGAGIIAERAQCDAESTAASTAMKNAASVASLLAHAAGLRTTDVIRNSLRQTEYTTAYQAICGPKDATPPMYDSGAASAASFQQYVVSVNGGVAFDAKSTRAVLPMRMHFLETAHVDDDIALVTHQFVIPNSDPFVSAEGRFSAIVKPDARIVIFYFPVVSSHRTRDAKFLQVRRVLERAGVVDNEILEEHGRIFVRPSSTVQLRDIEEHFSQLARQHDSEPLISIVSFIAHCERVRQAVTTSAYNVALERARIMASEAHLRIGSVIGVDDAGNRSGAICELGRDSSLAELVRAINESSVTLNQTGENVVFSTNLVVAWHLRGVKTAPRKTSLFREAAYGYSNLQQAFTTTGTGVMGGAREPLNPTEALLAFTASAHDATALRKYFRKTWLEQSSGAIRYVGDLRVAEPPQVKGALVRLRLTGAAPEHLQFRSNACGQMQIKVLREATDRALALARDRPIQALIDQGTIYQPSASLCGLQNDVQSAGMYVAGGYDDFDTAGYSIEERVAAVVGT